MTSAIAKRPVRTLSGNVETLTLNANTVINAIIVEDEIKSMNNLKNMLKNHCPRVEVVGDALSIKEALDLFDDPEMKPDVAFLDINLTDGLVFRMLEELRPIDFEIIFVTAYNEHAIKACEYSSVGFIAAPARCSTVLWKDCFQIYANRKKSSTPKVPSLD
jgi:response regulator of citrate/malate metabolism